MPRQTFLIAPGGSRTLFFSLAMLSAALLSLAMLAVVSRAALALWLSIIARSILLVSAVLAAMESFSPLNARIDLSERGVRIRGSIFGRFLPADTLIPDQAREVNLDKEPAFSAAGKRWGASMPGFTEGWFLLRGGGKALVFVTRRDRVICIPTRLGFVILFSPRRPAELINALQAYAKTSSVLKV